MAGGLLAVKAVCAHETAWLDQAAKIEAAAQSGADMVSIRSVPSDSRYTMSMILEEEPENWPNSTLGKYYGIGISGEK